MAAPDSDQRIKVLEAEIKKLNKSLLIERQQARRAQAEAQRMQRKQTELERRVDDLLALITRKR